MLLLIFGDIDDRKYGPRIHEFTGFLFEIDSTEYKGKKIVKLKWIFP